MTTQANDARLAKLPAWARDEIEHLRRDVDYWTARATAGPEDSDTFAYGDPAHARLVDNLPLGRGERIYFVIGEGERPRTVTAHVSAERGALYVSTSGGRDEPMIVEPHASNVVTIR